MTIAIEYVDVEDGKTYSFFGNLTGESETAYFIDCIPFSKKDIKKVKFLED